jgi:colanic acid biosynthesis glycosyl transferase WcaI
MKLLVLGINYDPELTGISVYNTEMCEFLVKKGHHVRMITGFPYYPFGMDFSSWYDQKKFQLAPFLTEIINGVEVVRACLYKPKEVSTIKRMIHELSFCFFALFRLLFSFKKYDVIICVAPPLFLGLVAYAVSRIKQVPFVFHVQDLQPDAAVELGMIKKGMLVKFLYSVERFIYNKAQTVFTISEGMRDKIISKGFDKDKVRLFYNWANTEMFAPLPKNNSFSKRHGLQNKFIVLHAGNMGQKQDMRIILEAARILKDDATILFLLVGRGVKRKNVDEELKKNNLKNILLLDVQPKSVVNEMFASADVALITQFENVKDIVMPSKVFGPALAERPLIIAAAEECEISRLAKQHHFGMVIESENADSLADAIKIIKGNRDLALNMGKNGRLFMLEERNMEKIINQFEKEVLIKT